MAYGKGKFSTVIGGSYGFMLFFANAEYDGVGIDVEGAEFRFKLVDPAGLTVRDYPTDPDYTVPGGGPTGWQAAGSVDLPLNSAGDDYLRGTYTLYVQLTDPGDTVTEFIETADFNPATTATQVNAKDGDGNYYGLLTADVNCQTAKVTVTDETDYTGWTKTDRAITLAAPVINGSSATFENDNVDDGDVQASFSWTNVTYTYGMLADRFKTSDESELNAVVIEWDESVVSSGSVDITCGPSAICPLLPCADSLFNKAYQEACANGGWARVNPKTISDLNAAINMLNMAHLHAECGNETESAAYRAKFEALLGSSCDCGCSGTTTTNEPIPYNP